MHALTGGACTPHAATVAERRRAALRFSDFSMALFRCRVPSEEAQGPRGWYNVYTCERKAARRRSATVAA